MANPSVKNGHIKIANELIEHFATVNITGQEWRIIWVLLRKTWGWEDGDRRKDWDWISITQFEKMTGMKKSNVYNSLKSLLVKRLILKQDNRLKFNQNYNEWLLVKRLTPLVKSITPISQKTNKTGSQLHNNKYNKTTNTNTKEHKFFEDRDFTIAFNGFKEHRRTIKKPLGARATTLLLNKLEKQTLEVATEMLNVAVEKGWLSVYPPKEDNSKDIYQKTLDLLSVIKYNTPYYDLKGWEGINLAAVKDELECFYPDQLDLLSKNVIKVINNYEAVKKHLTI